MGQAVGVYRPIRTTTWPKTRLHLKPFDFILHAFQKPSLTAVNMFYSHFAGTTTGGLLLHSLLYPFYFAKTNIAKALLKPMIQL